MEYSKLQDEITASKTEFERWKVESTLMKERDDAVHRASELEDTMHNVSNFVHLFIKTFPEITDS